MTRLLGYALVVLVVVLLMPTFTALAQQAIPFLLTVIVFVGFLQFTWSLARKRR